MAIAKTKNSMSFIDKKLVEDTKKGIGTAKRPPTLKGTISDLINDMNIKQSAEGSVDYDDWADNLINDLYGNREFTYDAETDPEWQSTKKEYTAEADKTMRDVLAQGAVSTGGIASTSAITAASEARDATMAGLEQQKAQLRNEAYSRYQQENAAKINLLGVIKDMADDKRNWYLSLLEKQESMNQDAQNNARDEVNSMLSMGILPSDDLLSSAGYSREYAEGIRQNHFDSMDTASMQRYLNSQGAKLSVDGSWGPATEAAYKKVFGKSSGRQAAYSSKKSPEYTPKDGSDKENKSKNYFQTGNKAMDKAQYDGLVKTIRTYISMGQSAKAKQVLLENADLLSDEQYNNLKANLA